MIVSGFALYVLLQTSSGVEEFIPQVYSDVEGCAAAEQSSSEGINQSITKPHSPA